MSPTVRSVGSACTGDIGGDTDMVIGVGVNGITSAEVIAVAGEHRSTTNKAVLIHCTSRSNEMKHCICVLQYWQHVNISERVWLWSDTDKQLHFSMKTCNVLGYVQANFLIIFQIKLTSNIGLRCSYCWLRAAVLCG